MFYGSGRLRYRNGDGGVYVMWCMGQGGCRTVLWDCEWRFVGRDDVGWNMFCVENK